MEKIRVGIIGLGRLGRTHANNIAFRIPNAQLIAASSLIPEDLIYAKEELGVTYTYSDYEEMLKNPEIDAVVVVVPSVDHCKVASAALDAGKHVFCEKPLGTDLEQCKMAEEAVERHPDKVFFLGFMRRYDESYAYAKKKIREGAIGKPYMVKATGIDPESLAENFLQYSVGSGGIFIDMAIHDIDLMRWFLEDEPVEVYALGATFKHPAYKELGDDETGVATYRFKNGGIGIIHVGRTAPHGYHVETEIVGTEGTIRISPEPEKNLAKLYNTAGVVTECVENFRERFTPAFLAEMQEFINCIQENRKPEVTVYDGTKNTAVGFGTTEAWKTGKLVSLE